MTTAPPIALASTVDPALDLAAQRVRAAADAVLPDPPSPEAITSDELERCLAALVDQLREQRDPALAWMILTALTGAFPLASDVRHVVRSVDLEEAPELTLAILQRAGELARVGLLRPMRVVGGVVVDVDMSARFDLHNGIQRVVRETVSRWNADHDIVLAAWTRSGGCYRTLTPAEEDRAVRWGRVPRVSAASALEVDQTTELIVPWRAVLVLAEVPLPDRCPRLAALAEFSGNSVRAVGYDAIPFISADLRPFTEPNAFASYLTAIKRAHRVACVSESAAAEFAGFGHALAAQGLPGPDVVAVPNPATVPDAPAGYVRVPPARPLIVTVGRLEPHKNHSALLDAVARLWRRGYRFDLKIIGGPGWDMRRVEGQLRELRRLKASVEWMRGVEDDDLWRLLRDASFSVFVSLHEGFGLPVAESLACGTPVLTTRYGSQAEIARHGGCLTVDPRDDRSVEEGLERMLTDEALMERLRADAAAYPVQSWATYASRLWHELVEERSA